MKRGAFQNHLTDAIALNRARRSFYATKTGGRSHRLSGWLIGLERLLVPAARLVDRWAARFDVPVVAEDIVSMEAVRPAAEPPRFRKRLTIGQRRRVAGLLRAWRRRLVRSVWRGEGVAACRATAAALDALARREARWRVHLAMSRHLLESAGYVARRGLDHARRSDGRTRRLTGTLVLGHAALAPLATHLDREAGRSHQRGAGILVNDLPAIPFSSKRNAARRFAPRGERELSPAAPS